MRSRPFSAFSRRERAFIRTIELLGWSVINILAFGSLSRELRNWVKSRSEDRCPVRRLQALTRDSAESIRSTSCWEDISKENIKTDLSCMVAVLRAISRAKVVLPILGLAARISKSEFCNPEI